MSEQDPGVQHQRQSLLQDVVRAVVEAHSGDDADVVRAALHRGMDEAGIPEQPPVWTESTVDEIAEGRHVVVDRRLGVTHGQDDGEDDHLDDHGVPEGA